MQPPRLMPGEEGAAMGRAWGVRTHWGVRGEGAKASLVVLPGAGTRGTRAAGGVGSAVPPVPPCQATVGWCWGHQVHRDGSVGLRAG